MNGQRAPGGRGDGLAMATMMAACCLALFLFFLAIPLVGWPIGVILVAAGFGAMVLLHRRFMGHGHR